MNTTTELILLVALLLALLVWVIKCEKVFHCIPVVIFKVTVWTTVLLIIICIANLLLISL